MAAGRDVSLREVRAAIKRGIITVSGRPWPPGRPVVGDEHIDIDRFIARAEAQPVPCADDRVAVVADLPDLLVLDKPSGMPTNPLRADETGTLLHAAVALHSSVASAGPPLEGGVAHRLDTGTSGIVLVAKTREARVRLRNAFRHHAVRKTYWALTKPPSWTTQTIIARIAGKGSKVRVVDGGQGLNAKTEAIVVRRTEQLAWIKASTQHGRRHQVRVHLSHAGAPLSGDTLYGGREAQRLGLHAGEVQLPDGRLFAAPLPPDLIALLEAP
ncbi:MAG: RluA family pseudouridine synthase [Myxococcota bacterium]